MTDIEKLLEKAEGSAADVEEQLNALAIACEEKLGIPQEQVFKRYEEEYSSLKKVLATKDENVIILRTFVKIKGFYGQELRSPALIFEGLTLGVTEPFDMVRGARQLAMAAWQEDQQKAIAEGMCDVNGIPLDTKANYASGKANPNFGKPLPEHAYIRNVMGIVEHDGQMKLFSMPLGDRHIDVPVLGMMPYTFRANVANKQNDPAVLSLNPYSRIEFSDFDLSMGDALQDNTEIIEGRRMTLDEIQAYHGRVANDPQRFCIVEADIMYIDPQPNPNTGNRMVVLGDETLPPDHPGVTAWMPESIPVDFGAGSRVVICGQTTETTWQGGGDEGGLNYIINITGVYAIPELKVPAEEVPQSAVRRVG